MGEKKKVVNQEALEQENALLRQKIADLEEKAQPAFVNAVTDSISSEIKKIKQKGKSSANEIRVYEKNDHKNISLWTKWGKRVGPLHPDEAVRALHRFADVGILLSADMPTPEQIAAYKETKEYKVMIELEAKRRSTKMKSKRSGQMEKLCEQISKLAGVAVTNKILSPEEVK